MTDVFFGFVFLLAAVVIFILFSEKSLFRAIAVALLGIGTTILFCGTRVEVWTGKPQLVTSFGATTGRVLEPGLNGIWPWESTLEMPTQYIGHTTSLEKPIEVKTADTQGLVFSVTTIYRRKQEDLLKIASTVGLNSQEQHLDPAIIKAINAIIPTYQAPEIFPKREDITKDFTKYVSESVADKGLEIIFIAFNDIDFKSSEYKEQNEKNQIKVQEKLEQQYNLTIAGIEAQKAELEGAAKGLASDQEARGDAESKRINADADSYSTGIKALADSEKKLLEGELVGYRLTKLAEFATPEIKRYLAVESWDGFTPDFMVGPENSLPFFDLMKGRELKGNLKPIEDLQPVSIEAIQKRLKESQEKLQKENELRLEELTPKNVQPETDGQLLEAAPKGN